MSKRITLNDLEVGKLVAMNTFPGATWFEIKAINGLDLLVAEPGLANAQWQRIDYSLVRQIRDKQPIHAAGFEVNVAAAEPVRPSPAPLLMPATLSAMLVEAGIDPNPVGRGEMVLHYGSATMLKFEWPGGPNGNRTTWCYMVLATIFSDGSWTVAVQSQRDSAHELRALAHGSFDLLNPNGVKYIK